MDDKIIHARSEKKDWAAGNQVETREAYIAIQDADQKQCPPSQISVAWSE